MTRTVGPSGSMPNILKTVAGILRQWSGASSYALRILVLSLSAGCIFSFLHIGEYLESGAAVPVNSDVIVVLGGGVDPRILTACRLYSEGYAHIILWGFLTHDISDHASAETHAYYRQMFLSNGVRDSDILRYPARGSTWSEALYLKGMLDSKGYRRFLIVTDPPHVNRVRRVYNKVFGNARYAWRIIPAAASWWRPEKWYRNGSGMLFVFKECMKNLYYTLMYRV